jgi:hypothetical protein
MTKIIWRIFKKRKEKYKSNKLTIPKFPFLSQKGKIKDWHIIKVQLSAVFFLFANFVM